MSLATIGIMCGRYALSSPVRRIIKGFAVREFFENEAGPLPDWLPRYNLAPTQMGLVIRQKAATDSRELLTMRWGLVPLWAKDESIGSRMINARIETARERPAFRDALERRRCAVPADAFYEWQQTESGKQPYCIHLPDFAPFAFAGLWERWRTPHDEWLLTYTILTTQPNDLLESVHDRMPAILTRHQVDAWVNPDADVDEMIDAARVSETADELCMHAVSTRVNDPKNDSPDCLDAIEVASEQPPSLFG